MEGLSDKESRPKDSPEAAQEAFAGASQILPVDDPDNWQADAEAAVLMLAASGLAFDADAVRAAGVPEPSSANRWGALFVSLRKTGYITPIDTVQSARRQRHAGLNRLWIGTEFAVAALPGREATR